MIEVPFEITPAEVAELLAAPGPPLLVDCREQDEYAICHLPGSHLAPLSDFQNAAQSLLTQAGPEGNVIVYCHHGMRSLRAVQYLRHLGLHGARSMAGGIDAWSLEVDPTMPRY